MTQTDLVRSLTTEELTTLLSHHGTVTAVVRHLSNGRSESLRRIIRQRIAVDGISWNRLPKSRYKYNETQLREALASASCWSDIYRSLGVTVCDHNKRGIVNLAQHHNITIPSFTKEELNKAYRRGKKGWVAADIFCENSKYARPNLRSAVLKYSTIQHYCCSKCNIDPEWEGEPLTLELDHVNGISTDNRVENLRWLCPNCHTQTKTYKGKNR